MGLNITEKKRKRQETCAVEAIKKAATNCPSGEIIKSDHGSRAEEELAALSVLPSLVVFDLDDTVWVGDIDMTTGPPFKTEGRGLPVLAQKGGHGDKVVPLPDVPEVFDWLEAHSIKVTASTHTFKPAWAAEALSLMETASGTKYSDLLVIPIASEIQRKNKDVHLRAIATETGISCTDMVFFDDKEHNVSDGRKAGATSCLVKEGLSWDKFVQCLKDFEGKKTGSSASSVPEVSAPKPVMPKTSLATALTAAAAPKIALPRHQAWKPPWMNPQRPQSSPPLSTIAAQRGWFGPNGAAWAQGNSQ